MDRVPELTTLCYIERDGRYLMLHRVKKENDINRDKYIGVGGHFQYGESPDECLKREVAEETGLMVKPSGPVLEIDEYYEDCKYISLYFLCEKTGETGVKLTEGEIKAGLEPRWISVKDALDIFSKHASYADTDEMKRGLYLREFTALDAITRA